MMLFYKAWRESRARFLVALSALVLFSIGFLLRARTTFPPPEYPMLPYAAVVWSSFFGAWRTVVFSMVALILGLGGLQRERGAGRLIGGRRGVRHRVRFLPRSGRGSGARPGRGAP